jgi:hypothetical protein
MANLDKEVGATQRAVAARTDAPPPDDKHGLSALEVEILNGRPRTLAEDWHERKYRARSAVAYYRHRARTIWREVRTLLGHIRFVTSKEYIQRCPPPAGTRSDVVLSPVLVREVPFHEFPRARILATARSDGIRRLSAEFPWAGPLDQEIFLEGWRAAEEWHAQNPGSPDCRIEQPRRGPMLPMRWPPQPFPLRAAD